ncbi:MAG: MotA/TolQ/ExbB proton channel family protein [Oscillospiraceae bacterium]|nr:MotA/TolQ/ExbB proton channel family protein [Oscillospiraceae bacterium]
MKGITTIIGMVIVFVCLFAGIIILGGEVMDFLDLPSVMLVLVPTLAAVLASFPMSVLGKIPGHFKALLGQESSPSEYIDKIVSLAEKARKEGLLAFEKEQVDDALMAYALRMMVDGLDKFTVKFALEDCINGIKERHVEAISIYTKAASYAPAFGMCATVISLVNMLMGLDFEDPNAINALGANMATALITTLYGSAFANGIFLPIAARLQLLHKKEIFCKTMVCNGLLAILNGDNPRVIKDFLVEQLSSSDAAAFQDEKSGGGGGGGE